LTGENDDGGRKKMGLPALLLHYNRCLAVENESILLNQYAILTPQQIIHKTDKFSDLRFEI
jgi:hypothetical protein